MFIKFLNALPNLNSIRISDLPLNEPMDLSVQDVIIFNAFLKINKITKLTLRDRFTIEQIHLMVDLFPDAYFFSLENVLNMDFENFLRCILMNINRSHPITICIVSIDANYDKIETLHQMIDSEHLLNNYTIHHQYNRFYLQWKTR
jgi:hypothetical protein